MTYNKVSLNPEKLLYRMLYRKTVLGRFYGTKQNHRHGF
jgi:hypothetical protein